VKFQSEVGCYYLTNFKIRIGRAEGGDPEAALKRSEKNRDPYKVPQQVITFKKIAKKMGDSRNPGAENQPLFYSHLSRFVSSPICPLCGVMSQWAVAVKNKPLRVACGDS
jgi:hypothetical protein